MEQVDNLPNDGGAKAPQSAETILQTITQDLQNLQQGFSAQLSQDVERLQREKARLIQDIEALQWNYQSLQRDYDSLQTEHKAALSSQQLAQQQIWAKRLAQTLATHLQARLTQSLYPTDGDLAQAGKTLSSPPNAAAFDFHAATESAYQLLSSLDSTLNSALQSLQQDLNGYQSSLSQQISRMHSMEQQGEAILEALVNRLNQQLQTQLSRPQMLNPPPLANGYSAASQQKNSRPNLPSQTSPLPPPQPRPLGVSSDALRRPPTSPSPFSNFAEGLSNLQKGLVLIVFSTLTLSIHNVLVGAFGYEGRILGLFPVEGGLRLDFSNALLLLWLRMVIILLLTPLIATRLYPPVWRDIRSFFGVRNRRSLFQVICSGCCLFLSQVFLYMAIAEVGPGVAAALLFMYPLITVPLAWFIFGDRPTPLRFVVIFAILMGVVFTALPEITPGLSVVTPFGALTGLFSGCAFALYLISMQISSRKLHPAPVSLFQFAIIFFLSSLLLIIRPFGEQVNQPPSLSALVLGGFLLGGLTVLGYLFNYYGVRFAGAARATVIDSSVPVITAVLAAFIIPGEKSSLAIVQWVGIILVVIGAIALGLEKVAVQQKGAEKLSRG